MVLHIGLKDSRMVVELWTFVAHDIPFWRTTGVATRIAPWFYRNFSPCNTSRQRFFAQPFVRPFRRTFVLLQPPSRYPAGHVAGEDSPARCAAC